MCQVYLSPLAGKSLTSYLKERGCQLHFMKPLAGVAPPLAFHPDLLLCKLGVRDDAPVFCGDPSHLRPVYPGDILYNACCTGRYFIHNLKHTAPELLAACGIAASASQKPAASAAQVLPGVSHAPRLSPVPMIPVPVSQGYAKCSIVCVDETSVITYDAGITKACRKAGLHVLQISPKHVLLPGYPTGFIGGTGGRIGREILFNGDLSSHPDFSAIRGFIEERGLSCVFFDDYPLTDIGSIIFSP